MMSNSSHYYLDPQHAALAAKTFANETPIARLTKCAEYFRGCSESIARKYTVLELLSLYQFHRTMLSALAPVTPDVWPTALVRAWFAWHLKRSDTKDARRAAQLEIGGGT